MMIDWVQVSIPYWHTTPINGGHVVSIKPSGEIDWQVEKRLQVRGSHDSSIQIRSEHKDHSCSHIRLDGNPVKFLQGHNVWGSCDLVGLIVSCLWDILPKVLPPDEVKSFDYLWITTLCGKLTRLDLTNMYDLGNSQRALSWLRAASDSANLKHRGKGQFSGDTLYWGKGSRRWTLKMYCKGLELLAHKPKQVSPDHPQYLESVTDFANKALRVELVLRGMELTKLGLSSVQDWNEPQFDDVYTSYLSGLEFSQNMKVVSEIKNLEKLPSRLRSVALLWSEGHDLREFYSRAQWYRHKKDILECIGLDISLPPPIQRPDSSNVIPLFVILEAKPMEIPEWAQGTPLYFELPARPKLLRTV